MSKVKKVTRGKGKGKVFKPEDIKTGLNGELYEIGKLIKEFMITTAEQGGKHKFRKDGSNSFYKSSKVEIVENGVGIEVNDYAQYINNGRKPKTKKVPISALIKWLKRYRIVSRNKKTGKYEKSSEGSINAAAYAIQQSIFKNGIKARPFLEKTLEYGEELISELIEDVLIPDIISIIEFNFKK